MKSGLVLVHPNVMTGNRKLSTKVEQDFESDL